MLKQISRSAVIDKYVKKQAVVENVKIMVLWWASFKTKKVEM